MILSDFTVIEKATDLTGNGCKTIFDEEVMDILSIGIDMPKEMIANGI